MRAKAKQALRRDLVTQTHELRVPKALLIDLDGVIFEGDREVEGARESLVWVTEQRIKRLFITNTTSLPRAALVEKLERLGIIIDATEILTPAVAAVRWLGEHAPGPIALFVPGATRGEFAALELYLDLPAEVRSVDSELANKMCRAIVRDHASGGKR